MIKISIATAALFAFLLAYFVGAGETLSIPLNCRTVFQGRIDEKVVFALRCTNSDGFPCEIVFADSAVVSNTCN